MTNSIIIIPTPDTFNAYMDRLPNNYGNDAQFRTTVIEAAIHRSNRYSGFVNNIMHTTTSGGKDDDIGRDYLESFPTPDYLHDTVLELIENAIETLTISIMKYLADEMITNKFIYVYSNDRDTITLATSDLIEQ